MKYLSFVLKLIWFCVCFSGNLYQIGQISDDFFRYQIVTTVNINFPDSFVAPAPSLCLYEVDIVDWKKLLILKPDVKERLNDSSLSNEEMDRKIRDMSFVGKRRYQGIMFEGLTSKTRSEIVAQTEDLFHGCLLTDPTDGATAIFTYYNCFQLNYKSDNYSGNILTSLRAETIPGCISLFRLTPLALNITSQAFLTFNTNKEYNRLGYMRGIVLSQLENLISLTYEEYGTTLLPPPYVTDCRDYVSSDVVSSRAKKSPEDIIDRGTCYESCLKSSSKAVFGNDIELPGEFVYEETIKLFPNLYHMTVHELYGNEEMLQKKKQFAQQCEDKCRNPTCSDIIYIPVLATSIEFPNAAMLLYTMSAPKIDTTCEPKLRTIGYLTNVFSTFGFWVGLSVFSFIEITADFLSELVKKMSPSSRKKEVGKGSQDNVTLSPSRAVSGWRRQSSQISLIESGNCKRRVSNRSTSRPFNQHKKDCNKCRIIATAYDRYLFNSNPTQ